LRLANFLAGNEESEVGLEVTLMGLKMIALSPLFIAVTGADLGFTINSEYQPSWGNWALKAGDVIHFRGRRSGLRAYLAAKGGFKAPVFMGSASVFQRGLMGTPLVRDEVLETKETSQAFPPTTRIPEEYLARMVEDRPIRVVMGPQEERFTGEGIDRFLHSLYRIRSQSDRMAYRLEGPKITHLGKADIISEPLMPGAIQVPNDGSPIILMADSQTTGGYAKIASVISADLSLLAQKAPGDSVRFEAIDLDTAYEALEQREQLLLWIRKNLRNPPLFPLS
jgi:antagonist of KipI